MSSSSHLLHGDAGRPEEDVAPPVSAHLAAPSVHQERHEDEHKLQREERILQFIPHNQIISDNEPTSIIFMMAPKVQMSPV